MYSYLLNRAWFSLHRLPRRDRQNACTGYLVFPFLFYGFHSRIGQSGNITVTLRNNSTVFEELEVSIVDLMVASAVLLAMRSGASKTDICDRQIHN
jgi:hypothetical protein